MSEVQREEQAAASGWPECAWNNLESDRFSAKSAAPRRTEGAPSDPTDGHGGVGALCGSGGAPVITVPLGEFLRDFEDAPEVDKEQAAGTSTPRGGADRIEPFVAHGLGVTRDSGKKETILMREGDGGSLEGEGEGRRRRGCRRRKQRGGDGDPHPPEKPPLPSPRSAFARDVGPGWSPGRERAQVGRAVLAHAESPSAPAAGSDGSDEEEFTGDSFGRRRSSAVP